MASASEPPEQRGSERHATSEELATYALDRSQLDSALADHIATCALCQPEAVWFDGVIQDLDRYPGCPTVDALTRFALGESSEDELLAVAAHLRGCSACAEEVAITREAFPSDVSEEVGLFAAIRRVVATLAPGVQLAQRDVPDALSAQAAAQSRSYQAGDIKVQLGSERDGETYVVTGAITHAPSATNAPGIENEALLYLLEDVDDVQRLRLVAHAHLEADLSFDLYDVPAGAYRLDMLVGDTMIVFEPITVP
jgi:anti-sigma factor RsiW